MDPQDREAFITLVTLRMMDRYAGIREFITFLDPGTRIYVGSDEHGDAPPTTVLRQQAVAFAASLSSGDPDLASRTGVTLMRCLWGSDEVPREFWSGVVGTEVAKAIGYHQPICPYVTAAVILNVSRQRIGQMVTEGRLRAAQYMGTNDIGILPSSLRQELLLHGRRP